MSTPEPKPIATLSKQAYAKLCEHIYNASPEHASILVELMTTAMRECLGFDPCAKRSPEECRQIYEQEKKRCERDGKSHYERTKKPRYERLKKQYPDIPTHILISTPVKDLPALNASYKEPVSNTCLTKLINTS